MIKRCDGLYLAWVFAVFCFASGVLGYAIGMNRGVSLVRKQAIQKQAARWGANHETGAVHFLWGDETIPKE